jgi:hypothetical protein
LIRRTWRSIGSLHFGGLAFGDHVVEDFQYRSGTAA